MTRQRLMEQRTLFVLGSQYVLLEILVLAPFHPAEWIVVPFDFFGGVPFGSTL
jgi:hypothetical protein